VATSGELCTAIASTLGIPFETTREHLRNIRRAGMISFKGHGRGAADMTALDAARLLITAAASPFVKDSIETLQGFGELKLARKTSRPRGMRCSPAKVTMETYLAEVIEDLIDGKEALAPAYRPPHEGDSRIALRMMSVVAARPADFPRSASIYRFFDSGVAMDFSVANFSSRELSRATLDSDDFANQVRIAGLLQTRVVPAWALAAIAHSLQK
jgi:hypothetical protein